MRYEMQWDEETHMLAERAARASGLTSVKAYVTQLVKQHAPEVLKAYNVIQLDNVQCSSMSFVKPVITRHLQQLNFARCHRRLTKRDSC